MDRIMLETLGKMRDAFGVLYEASGLIVAHAFGEYAADVERSPSQPFRAANHHSGNGFQEIISEPAIVRKTVADIIEEVKKLIIELKIKGSVREHRNGLLKFTSTALGCVYGRTKEEIEKELKKRIKQLNKQKKDKPQAPASKKASAPPSPLLSEYYTTEYFPHKRHQNLAESSLASLDCLMRFIKKAHFDKRLTEYTPKMIEDFLYSFPQTRKRQKMQCLLNNMFTRAVALELIPTNPCAPIEKMQHKQEQGKAFSFDEQDEFFASLFQSDELTYAEKCYFVFLYLTGARRTEALSVREADVDFKNKVLSIRGTKTEGSNRKIPLTPLVEALLRSLTPDKGNYFSLWVDKCFHAVWDKTKGHKPHDLRHTFGTIQICTKKIDMKTVSLWLGHSTINMTANTYTHPEQLDSGLFLRGDLSNDEKVAVCRQRYDDVLKRIEAFICDGKQ